MTLIDKNMFESIKSWWEGQRPSPQHIMYVNSSDRQLTDSTIKKLMYEIYREDTEGEIYSSLYSAENFYRNMREYYSHIARLYFRDPKEDTPLVDIIDDMPPTCGWLLLIVKDFELFSGGSEELEEMMKTFLEFAANRAYVILIGNGDYKDVFSGCEFASNEIRDCLEANEDDGLLMAALYEQNKDPEVHQTEYDVPLDELKELIYFWELVREQFDHMYFDYDAFKELYARTLRYLMPHVSKENLPRHDVRLIEKIKCISTSQEVIDGGKPWELDASVQFVNGLEYSIVNLWNDNDDFSEGSIQFDVMIKERPSVHGAIHMDGCLWHTEEITAESAADEMDKLAEMICDSYYKGDVLSAAKRMLSDDEPGRKGIEEIFEKIGSLTDGIKAIADETVNKEPERKVRRHKKEAV